MSNLKVIEDSPSRSPCFVCVHACEWPTRCCCHVSTNCRGGQLAIIIVHRGTSSMCISSWVSDRENHISGPTPQVGSFQNSILAGGHPYGQYIELALYMYTHTHIHIHVYIYVCITQTHIYIYMYIHIYIHTYNDICICVCVHIQ